VYGVIELVGIVEKNGRVKKITVVKRLPYGLTSQAIETVQKWKLTPAKDPKGHTTEVRQIFRLTFAPPSQ
jgi:hypothetical protein